MVLPKWAVDTLPAHMRVAYSGTTKELEKVKQENGWEKWSAERIQNTTLFCLWIEQHIKPIINSTTLSGPEKIAQLMLAEFSTAACARVLIRLVVQRLLEGTPEYAEYRARRQELLQKRPKLAEDVNNMGAFAVPTLTGNGHADKMVGTGTNGYQREHQRLPQTAMLLLVCGSR